MKMKRDIAMTIVCTILGIIVAMQFRSISNNKIIASLENKTIGDLRKQILSEKKTIEDLSKRNQDLIKELSEFETKQANDTSIENNLKTELLRAKIIAGLVSVKGKGVIVTLDDNKPANVSEDNLLEVLNELKASDAQAISVNEERIVAISEVREAGRYIMINGKQMLPPFTIKAIADPDKLEHTLKMIGGVKERLEEIYFLKVDIIKSDEIIISEVIDDGSIIKTNLLIPVAQ